MITYNPPNTNFRKWIQEEMHILHQDDKTKQLFPKIDVVTRQGKNISDKVINSRHWKFEQTQGPHPHPPPGNFKKHSKNCKACLRMTDGKKEFSSSKTERSYQIKRHYTCESTHLVYLVRCRLCNIDYVGQTTQSMRERHWGHRSEIRSGADGLGKHFLGHGVNLNLKNEKIFEESVMRHFDLTVIASVQPGQPWTQVNLDRLEGKFQKNLMSMDYNGGMDVRDETKRIRKAGT